MSLKTACLSLTAMVVVTMILITIISEDIQGVEEEHRAEGKARRKREDEADNGAGESKLKTKARSHDEITVGGKMFKLYEKKKLVYKKATAFCKKHEGRLAQAANLDEMRSLQVLLMRAKSLGNDMWVGADKKEWKKHSLKMQRRPEFGPDPMMFGGGPTEMCPALSFSTRSLFPVSCTKELPWICEFDKNSRPKRSVPTTTTKPSTKRTTTRKAKSIGRGGKKTKMEMRKKRELDTTDESVTTGESLMTEITDGSSSTDSSVIFDSETLGNGNGDATETPAEKAAEHNIGFSPHVEQAKAGSEHSPPVTDTPTQHFFQVKLSTNLFVKEQIDNTLTSTMDPDQFMMELMDEQTVNLTAIELESSARKITKPISVKRQEMLEEIIENNQIGTGNPVSKVGMTSEMTLSSSMIAKTEEAGLLNATFAFEEFMDGNFYNTSSYIRDGNADGNETFEILRHIKNETHNSTGLDESSSYSTTEAMGETFTGETKRQVRNVTSPHDRDYEAVSSQPNIKLLNDEEDSNSADIHLAADSSNVEHNREDYGTDSVQENIAQSTSAATTEISDEENSTSFVQDDIFKFQDKSHDPIELQSIVDINIAQTTEDSSSTFSSELFTNVSDPLDNSM